jgi:hypothetical protein
MTLDQATADHRRSVTSLGAAMLDYFGKNGKDTQGFMAEFRALTQDDRAEFKRLLKEIGYAIV